jgi:hypothetical protein
MWLHNNANEGKQWAPRTSNISLLWARESVIHLGKLEYELLSWSQTGPVSYKLFTTHLLTYIYQEFSLKFNTIRNA